MQVCERSSFLLDIKFVCFRWIQAIVYCDELIIADVTFAELNYMMEIYYI